MEFKVIIDDDEMSLQEREEFCTQLRDFVMGEWWNQYSATVIGPYPEEGK